MLHDTCVQLASATCTRGPVAERVRCLPPSPLALLPPLQLQVKENICKEGFIVDKDDNSLTRSNSYMMNLFGRAGLSVAYNIKQKNFPKNLFEVRMYVLKVPAQQQ